MTANNLEHPAAPSHDFNAARFFLHCLDPGRTDFTFQTFCDDKNRKDRTLARTVHGSFEDLKAALVELNDRGAGVFVTINATDGPRRSENITYTRGIWHEDDVGLDRIFPLLPSLVVETSNGKFHRHWFTQGLTVGEHAGIMATMVSVHGSDHRATDIVRVLRLPGFYHRKGDPFLVRIIGGASMLFGGPVRFPRDKIRAAFPPAPRQLPPPKTAAPRGDFDRPKAFQALGFIPAIDRDVWLTVGMALHAETGGSFEAYKLWETWSENAPDKFDSTDQEQVWASFKNEGEKRVTAGTLYYLAAQHGWKHPTGDPGAGFTAVAPQAAPSALTVRASDVAEKPTRFLWYPYLPAGAITLLGGRGGVGKGLVSAHLASTVTTGSLWPLGTEKATAGRVLWCEAEDAPAQTLKPRFVAAGADCDRIDVVNPRDFINLDLKKHIRETGTRLVVMSPMVSFLKGLDNINAELETRKALEAIQEAVEDTDCAVLGIGHLNKKADLAAIERMLGSVAFTNFVRSVLLVAREDQDADISRFAHAKHNLSQKGPDLLYTPECIDPDRRSQRVRLSWSAPDKNVEVEGLYDRKKEKGERPPSAREWLKEFLRARGPTPKEIVLAAAEGAGHSADAVERAQRRASEINYKMEGLPPKSIWFLGDFLGGWGGARESVS